MHKPTDETRKMVEAFAGYGITQDEIAAYLKIARKTLHKHYAAELELGVVKANAAVIRNLHFMASKGKNPAAAIFWAKTRMRWRETDRLEVTAADGKPFTAVIEFAVAKHKLNGQAAEQRAFEDYLSLPAPKAAKGTDNESD